LAAREPADLTLEVLHFIEIRAPMPAPLPARPATQAGRVAQSFVE
jgi:hypothetical protein